MNCLHSTQHIYTQKFTLKDAITYAVIIYVSALFDYAFQ